MNIYLGEKGLNETWQNPFSKTIECHKCKKQAKIMFVGCENKRNQEFVCNLHKTTGKEGELWLHDACAIAVYLCPFCFEVSAELNQA